VSSTSCPADACLSFRPVGALSEPWEPLLSVEAAKSLKAHQPARARQRYRHLQSNVRRRPRVQEARAGVGRGAFSRGGKIEMALVLLSCLSLAIWSLLLAYPTSQAWSSFLFRCSSPVLHIIHSTHSQNLVYLRPPMMYSPRLSHLALLCSAPNPRQHNMTPSRICRHFLFPLILNDVDMLRLVCAGRSHPNSRFVFPSSRFFWRLWSYFPFMARSRSLFSSWAVKTESEDDRWVQVKNQNQKMMRVIHPSIYYSCWAGEG